MNEFDPNLEKLVDWDFYDEANQSPSLINRQKSANSLKVIELDNIENIGRFFYPKKKNHPEKHGSHWTMISIRHCMKASEPPVSKWPKREECPLM